MFSILCPSRGRPANITRLYKSLKDTTEGEWELLVRLDDDDPARLEYPGFTQLTYITAPRRLMSALWNDLVLYALGDVLMMCGDDVTFNSEGWDSEVRAAFPADTVALIHGNDLSPNSATIATHPFLSRLWVETVGYLTPPYFTSDYVDLWLTEVADVLNRRVYLPDVIVEHHHPSFDKADWDATYQERVERADGMEQIWAETADKRREDSVKLLALIL